MRTCGKYKPNHMRRKLLSRSMELQGARAIVTGGASGIGAACVSQLEAAGASVAVLDMQGSPSVDVSDEAQVVAAINRAVETMGGLDIAVLCAGIGGSARLVKLTTDEWDRVMNVNLRGAFICMRESARAMHDGGAIVAITSVSGYLADRTLAHYAVSKAGLAQLVRVAARELGPGIRVNAVAPGTTDTPMFAATTSAFRDRSVARTPLGRLGTPDDIARVVLSLCTLEWVTGQIVTADGGVALFSPIDPTER
jgi:NAD(P)-dependent dehydrogenase (short-subunit alcohol dehydrogenase family)